MPQTFFSNSLYYFNDVRLIKCTLELPRYQMLYLWEAGKIYSGFYFGFKAFNGNYRIGHDGAWSQDFFQNGIHKNFVKSPYFNTSIGSQGNLFFQRYRNLNQWSLYTQ